jgi:RNA polymerase sigma-70 factor (ECF subfamily)
VSDWDCIVREHGPGALATAKRILGQVADAEDVVQEVLLEAHHLDRARPVRHWPGFLRRLTTCRALDRLRRRKSHEALGLNVRDVAPGPEEAAMARELAERLRQALTQLPARESEVFCLRYFEEQTYQQIAEALEIQAGAVAQALRKARAKLESLLHEAVKGA